MNNFNVENKTVGEIAALHPDSYKIFHKHKIDFCCGGKRKLEDVCNEKGIEFSSVVSDLEAMNNKVSDEKDWNKESLESLIEHIVDNHHKYLREELPRLGQLANKVADRHGDKDSHLAELVKIFSTLSDELLQHIVKEEQVLFPMIIEMEKSGVFLQHVLMPIMAMEEEHEEAGQALEKLEKLTNGYTIEEHMCASYQALYLGLKQLDADLKLHIHKENNILFPRARQ